MHRVERSFGEEAAGRGCAGRKGPREPVRALPSRPHSRPASATVWGSKKSVKAKTRPHPFRRAPVLPQIPQRRFVSRVAGRKSGSHSISGEAHRPWQDPRVRVSARECVCVRQGEGEGECPR